MPAENFLSTETPLLLYLDYDGVLHPEDVYRHPTRGVFLAGKYPGHSLFEHAEMLADELAPYPDLRVVLSSSWVRVLRYRRALSYLPKRLQERVIGSTFHTRMNQDLFLTLSRGQQVLGDASRRRATRWLALDDDAEDWPESHRENLVHTDPVGGLAAVLPELRFQLRRYG
jgi:hypothetical protein